MTPNSKINSPQVLKAYLSQEFPKVGLEKTDKERIIVDSYGGLAYHIFQKEENLTLLGKLQTVNDLIFYTAHLNNLKNYVDAAEEHAEEFGFGLVAILGGYVLSPINVANSPVHQLAIGQSRTIGSARKEIKRFLEMIKEGRGELNKMYLNVMESAKVLQGRK